MALILSGNGAIQTVAGTNAITIDSSSRVLTSNTRPAFIAHAQGSSAYTNVSVGQPFPANATILNQGSHFNTTTYRFTAPVTGLYLFTFSSITATPNVVSRPMFYVNGSADTYGCKLGISGGDNGSPQNSTSALIYVQANDYVDVRSQSGALYYYGAQHSTFSGCLIG